MRHNVRHNPGSICDIIIVAFMLLLILDSSNLYSRNKKKQEVKKKVAIARVEKKASVKDPVEEKDVKVNEDGDKTGSNGNNPIKKDYTESDFKPVVEEESYGWLIFKTILIMGIIVAGFYYFLKYVTKKAGVHVLGQDAVEILSMVPIGQNKYLQIVDLAGKLFVLGIAENSINLITEIDEKSEIDRIRLLSSKSSGERGKGFHEYISKHLGGFLGKLNDKKPGSRKSGSEFSDSRESGIDLNYLKKQRKRLRNLNGFNDE